ncbi:FAD-dependent 5-carboxymethylaminomethyl-2-thiouridine(34) oxidoreductase MnmC [Psychrobacter sp. FDAARGOS_221]|uniref:FAD-dependent 5-carboxymethylaminomethyl-2-thiouridine(34) oxidoreductase MnmC n=1 Tax=Psychrobacter sp. FDAARGOS_221 TaxID=1975705 RepID=UPI000BB53772|nr:FAD-dependent 5-carboxymethylaminomethyl-2-thiouridine(34) oxidoreductase MnmC [Psychrobacter sp. FDAARGOS_221]PNK61178.1 FAD-dependent oxidoreductase [Psychrobacter sp. FDAARGOS_221]
MSKETQQANHEVSSVTPAKLSWRADEQGHLVPVSDVFGDVYYSLVDGLAESRYVFVEQNNLPARFEQLFQQALQHSNVPENFDSSDKQNKHDEQNQNQPLLTANHKKSHFTIAELGFGTGLNVLVTWQLWRQTQQQFAQQLEHTTAPTPHLHLISTEKFPLTHEDLSRSLASWQQEDASLAPYIEQLLALYPTLVAGCHRLHLATDVTLDLWLGDAADSLQQLGSEPGPCQHPSAITPYALTPYIDAWYLDGFAPACNESLWAQQIFAQIARLSTIGTTAATFSSAGVVRRGLAAAGFSVNKVKGFGRKREMVTAIVTQSEPQQPSASESESQQTETGKKITQQAQIDQAEISQQAETDSSLNDHLNNQANINQKDYQQVAVIGAGISGLMAAWSLAQCGLQVTLIDKDATLSGASGNPRALLAPKMTPLAHVAEHLHSISYLYSQRLYRQLDNQQLGNQTTDPILSATATLDLLTKANVSVEQIADYPQQMATTLSHEDAQQVSGLSHQDLQHNLYLPQAGLVNPRALADKVLSHPNINFVQANIEQITPVAANPDQTETQQVHLSCQGQAPITADAVIIAAAFASKALDERIFEFRKIRGQLSWFEPSAEQLERLPKLPLKYGGYCARFTPTAGDELINPVHPDTPTFLLGASFVRNQTETDIRESEHQVNHDKLITAIPELTEVLADSALEGWQARVGIRAQTPDYHPLVGPVDEDGLIWTLSGMGSKGYAFAPLCAQALADMMMGRFCALPSTLLARLSPQRKALQKPLTP